MFDFVSAAEADLIDAMRVAARTESAAVSQTADGTVIFTSPTGHRYTTEPAGALLYPALSTLTGTPDVSAGNGPQSTPRVHARHPANRHRFSRGNPSVLEASPISRALR
jgi:hypothetical protein